ncbi:MAG: Do family serine endopeptidase, partial [Cytophagales bacterium]|nr:Do family serine endopeptidase [Cytophagales bacterium]
MSKKQLFFVVLFSACVGGMVAFGGLFFYSAPQPASEDSAVSDVEHTMPKVTFTNISRSAGVQQGNIDFVEAAAKTTPAVVHIKTFYESRYNYHQYRDPWEEFFNFRRRQTPRSRMPRAQASGSGVIISEDGYIATNNHVVDNANEITVTLNDNRTFKAKVIGTDPRTDLALLKIDAEGLASIPYGDADAVRVGEWVLAVGNPFNLTSTVTAGIVSAKGRNINILADETGLGIESFIQTDAAVNPGNSGGALVNLRGELIGINTAIASPTQSYAGYAFAVPVSIVHKVISDLKKYGVVQRAILGVTIESVNSKLAKEKDLSVYKGVYVRDVVEDGAAKNAGIESGDVIVAVDGEKVNSVSELQESIALRKPGDMVTVTYLRGKKKKSVKVELKNASGRTGIVNISSSMFKDRGATFKNVSKSLASKLGIDGGVVVSDLKAGAWASAGIKKGFIITAVDRTRIGDVQDMTQVLNQFNTGDGVLIQ